MYVLVCVILTAQQWSHSVGARRRCYGCTAGGTPTVQTSERESLETEFVVTVKPLIGGKKFFLLKYMLHLLRLSKLFFPRTNCSWLNLNRPHVCLCLWSRGCLSQSAGTLFSWLLLGFNSCLCSLCVDSRTECFGNNQGWKADSLPVRLMIVVKRFFIFIRTKVFLFFVFLLREQLIDKRYQYTLGDL